MALDLEAKTISRIVREREKLQADLMSLAPGPRKRALERYQEEAAALVKAIQEAK